MIYLYWILFIAYSAIVIGTIITVLMDNRQPVKTMAWVMAVMFMPVAGVIL